MYSNDVELSEQSTPAATAAASTRLAETAFRRAEKKYQLHHEHQLRIRKGRARGGKLVAKETDLSDVLDVRSINHKDVFSVAVPQPCLDSSSSSSSSSSTIPALVFRHHPGLVVFPAAVEPQLQLQLIHAALEEWPDPPARTNHTKAYGTTLCGLFQAAQQGLVLAQQPQQQQQQQQPQQQPSQSANQHCQQQQQQHLPHHLQEAQHCQQHCHICGGRQQQDHIHHGCDTSSTDTNSTSSPWAPTGGGPQATLLLRKLRWVCLGPPYNWTDRVYEPHLPHRPLPAGLVHMACQFAELSAQAMRAASQALQPEEHAGPAGLAEAQLTQPIAEVRAPLPAAASVCRPGSSVAMASYVPDAALVNYYHAGDTLNGHKDDVERDLTQPIVTLSLGCDAVFLVGGQTRDVEPVALLLRSGDLVVMAEQARACYHGIPRVLTDRCLPLELLQAAEQHGQMYQPYIKHMQGCRINISMRATR